MADDIGTVRASCLCGNIRYNIDLPRADYPLRAGFCHCNSCRHVSGTLCMTMVFPPKRFQPSAHLLNQMHSFQFSERCTQYSCTTCGSKMLERQGSHDLVDSQVTWGIMSGTLEKADGVFEVKYHCWIEDTLDGGFSDFFQPTKGDHPERWLRGEGQSEKSPLFWQSPTFLNAQPPPQDRLHAHCKCGGVSFYIARPSTQSALGKAPWPDVLIPFHSMAPKPQDGAWWLAAGGTKFLAGVCSCDSCRLACGVEWVEWAFVPVSDITLDADGRTSFSREFGKLKRYESSPGVRRYFCGGCAATIFWDGDERPDVIDVGVGLLDAAEGARAESWLQWRSQRISFREDAIPRAESLILAAENGMKQYGHKYQGIPFK
ncbi:hypothetical protein BAUCODRAFT_37935 [Baudoinia panamericana UAMH 10762]|uniref:CENP-V/GFA domain-containing protein n=1 Tax=Baudoinia panamericana (strain UAMH 10762) TaxID=717646 RepID=M2LG58_BAUPA|nr:uncharacterized protein BAUCODRAFT_37935 [Baudoinia panamericana UAMH 10762]EMC93007.1 hypothetical protein BAUCODRAFT_37935 [Baudoinia panamericana UAMH 10762]